MRKTILEAAFAAMAIAAAPLPGAGYVQATEERTEAASQRIVLSLGSDTEKKRLFLPDNIVLEAGKRYTLVIQNPSYETHEFDSPGLVAAAWSSDVKVLDGIGKTALPVAVVVGKPAEMEVSPGGTVEWTFVPVETGIFEMVCDIKDKNQKTHTEMGMKGRIIVRQSVCCEGLPKKRMKSR